MASELISNIAIIAIALGFAFSLRLSDVPKYLIYGVILTSIGAIGLLNFYSVIALEMPKLPAVTYAVNIVAILVGGGLMRESISERSAIISLQVCLALFLQDHGPYCNSQSSF